jgi:ParB family chromosome partitioning protein
MTEQLVYLPCNKIAPNRYQPRKEFKVRELEELAESIDTQGLIQPITVRKASDLSNECEYELIAGERRWRATKEILGKDKIRAIVKEMTDEASQEAAITENLQRQDLNPMEEAIALNQLMDHFSLTQDQVAKRLGKSRSYIANAVRLTRLNKEVVALIQSGALDRSKATALLAVTEEGKQTELAKNSISKNWTVEKLRVEIEKIVAKDDPNNEKKVVRKEINGKIVTVATPSKGHRRKTTQNLQAQHFVLVELDKVETVKDFVDYMTEQEWKCWTGDAAIKQLELLKQPVVEKAVTTAEPLIDFEVSE